MVGVIAVITAAQSNIYVFFEKTHFSIFPITLNIFYPILDLSNYIQFCFYFFELSTTTKTLHFLGKVCCWQRVFSRNQLK